MSNDTTKMCTKCGVEKPLDEFYRQAAGRGGLRSDCRACTCRTNAAYRAANPEKIAARKAAYQAANPENRAVYRAANYERIAAREAVYRAANSEKRAAASRKYQAANPEKMAAYYQAYRAVNADKIAASKRKYNYGITQEQYDALLEKQCGCCAICGEAFGDKTPHVDHCHESKRVRGLLCQPCNHAIGLLRDDPAICRSAVTYLDAA